MELGESKETHCVCSKILFSSRKSERIFSQEICFTVLRSKCWCKKWNCNTIRCTVFALVAVAVTVAFPENNSQKKIWRIKVHERSQKMFRIHLCIYFQGMEFLCKRIFFLLSENIALFPWNLHASVQLLNTFCSHLVYTFFYRSKSGSKFLARSYHLYSVFLWIIPVIPNVNLQRRRS